MRKNILQIIQHMLRKICNNISNLPLKVKRNLLVVLICVLILAILVPISLYYGEKQKLVVYTGNNLNEKEYPGYKELIDELQSKHPNWQFTLLYTKLNWEEVIKQEGHSDKRSRPLNLIPDSSKYPGDWRCPMDQDKTFDNGSWYCASDKAIKYQMDPRNLLNDDKIFQLKQLNYLENSCTLEGIMEKTEDSFLEGESVANSLIEAGKEANIDPYFIVARLIQEQGKKGTTLSRGYTYEDKTIYNPFNIAASGNSKSEILNNAAQYAYSKNWDTIEKAIAGGIYLINDKYINKGQNTLYLQKFDIIKDDKMYDNQYMQNLLAPQSEASIILDQYEVSNTTEENYNFIIPLYEKMPEKLSER